MLLFYIKHDLMLPCIVPRQSTLLKMASVSASCLKPCGCVLNNHLGKGEGKEKGEKEKGKEKKGYS